MVSTEALAAGPIRALDLSDLPGALELSLSARWNQNEGDWRALLTLGEGWGIDAPGSDGRPQLAASTVLLPYGRSFAWISMVLVRPEFQRRGCATRLLRHTLQCLAARGATAVLDATPAGRAVYAREGFADSWGFARWRRERAAPIVERPSGPATRALRASDWAAIQALDLPAFGADRMALLRLLAQRWPEAAHVVEQGGCLRGFVLGRDGREAHQIGPLLADDLATATALIGAALHATPGSVYLDLLDRCAALRPWLEQQGFALQRPFTRMVHGAAGAPGDPRAIVLVAGPELG